MKGDFSRDSFNRAAPTARVLRLQGGIDLDADWNEQVASLLFHQRGLTSELIGWHGSFDNGFRIELLAGIDTVRVARGSYYVDGLRADLSTDQVFPVGETLKPPVGTPPAGCLLYVDVWERFLTGLEDDTIREIALAGRDTSARTRVVARVLAMPLADSDLYLTRENFQNLIFDKGGRQPFWGPRPGLRAWVADAPTDSTGSDRCLPIPSGGFRGPENQLYRVEIQEKVGSVVSFKWSRDNGSFLYAVRALNATDAGNNTTTIQATLADAHGTGGERLVKGDWVELQSDLTANDDHPPLLMCVDLPRGDTITFVALKGSRPTLPNPATDHVFLRRWDMKDPTVPVVPDPISVPVSGSGSASVLAPAPVHLEKGVYVRFEEPDRCLPGDYWLIPARTITRDIVWPRARRDSANPKPPEERAERVDASRVSHSFAPLAKVTVLPGTAATNNTPATNAKLVIDETFARRQLTPLPLAGRDQKAQGDELKKRLQILLDGVKVKSKFTNKPNITMALVPLALYPDDLQLPPTGDLATDAPKTFCSLGEIATLTDDGWVARLVVARGTAPANPAEYRRAAVALAATAREVAQLFRDWPDAELTKAQFMALFP